MEAWDCVDKYELSIKLSNWHASQWDAIYAVSSSLYADNEEALTYDIVSNAIYNLNSDLRKVTDAESKQELEEVIADLELVLSRMDKPEEE